MNSINNNLVALHTANTLNSHYGRLSTSVGRLSSGMHINSAADDAAGLAIRELMRADIAALSQGQRNVNDAISMIQAADGALAIIDEKLIRMKELAEQAATGTYDSTQRLMIDSEFQAMASEIDRIARATAFNGINLLDGSLSGAHNGRGPQPSGAMKIHFGSGNDSAEDYYYVQIADCTTRGLGLRQGGTARVGGVGISGHWQADMPSARSNASHAEYGKFSENSNGMTLNDCDVVDGISTQAKPLVRDYMQRISWKQLEAMPEGWYITQRAHSTSPNYKPVIDNCCIIYVPAGTTDLVLNICGVDQCVPPEYGDNDIQLFTVDGKHLAGTPLSDAVFAENLLRDSSERQAVAVNMLEVIRRDGRVKMASYDACELNTGPDNYDSTTLKYSFYNGMTIGYTGDPERQDSVPENLALEDRHDHETLTIDIVTEPLVIALPGSAGTFVKAYSGQLEIVPVDAPGPNQPGVDPVNPEKPDNPPANTPASGDEPLSIETQEKAQKALSAIDNAIVAKDKIRAHLGALQNRLENTVSSLSIQAVNLQASESRISDADVALEMTEFVRNQVLTQSAVAVLGQANSYPRMLMQLLA